MTTPSTPPAGWYPDPEGRPSLRYWDGTNWTISSPAYEPTTAFSAPSAPVLPPVRSAKPVSNRVKIGIAAGIAVVAVGFISLLGDGDSTKAESSSTRAAEASASESSERKPSSAPKTGQVAAAGSAVRDGKFEFQVLGVERGATSIDDAFGPEIAKGEFFTVRVRVTNVGDDARNFSATNQKLIIKGNEYEATSFMDNGWMEDINPGLGIDTQVTFDIPPGAVPEAIEFHDSLFSGGVLVALPPAS